jgi:hypothetical protein
MPRHVIGHACGHMLVHHVTDFGNGSREMEDMERWHHWLWSQPCLNCLRPPGLIAAKAGPAADRLSPPATAAAKPKRPRNANPWKFPSRFTKVLKPVFQQAGLSLQQARMLEYLFLRPDKGATYRDLTGAIDMTATEIEKIVATMVKRGLLRRSGDGRSVFVDYVAWWIRSDYPAWGAWIAAATRQP